MDFIISKPVAMFEMGNRTNQEDSIFPEIGKATADDRLFLVCDGMGGHEHGEVASGIVCSVMPKYILESIESGGAFSDELIAAALEKVYAELEPYDNGSAKKMGTTMTLACLHNGGCTVAHIGDSRIYHIRPNTREVLYRSRDHSLVFDLYRAGEISYDEMRTSPGKSIITKAIQPGTKGSAKPDVVHIGGLQKGDYIFLCSDGVLEEMEDDDLVGVLAGSGSDVDKMERLKEMTAKNADNHSAYLIHIEDVVSGDGEVVADDEADSICNAVNIIKKYGGPKAKSKNGGSGNGNAHAGSSHTKIWVAIALAAVLLALLLSTLLLGKG